MSSTFNETLEAEIAAIDAEIAAVSESTKSQLTTLRERKKMAQELRRTYATSRASATARSGAGTAAAAPVRRRRRRKTTTRVPTAATGLAKKTSAKKSSAKKTSAAKKSTAKKTSAKKSTAKKTSSGRRRKVTAGVPYSTRREQVLKLLADSKSPVGSAELAKGLKLTATRARQLVDQMLADGTITAREEMGPQKRTRRVFTAGAKATT